LLSWSGQKKMKKKEIILLSFLLAVCAIVDFLVGSHVSWLALLTITCFWINETKRVELFKTDNKSLLDKLDTAKEMYESSVNELSLLRQKHSRTNQPRSGGKFVAALDESGITRDPKIGDKYICIRDVDMVAYIAFTVGKEYSSRINGCITNNKDNGSHIISKNFAKLHFKLLNP